MTRPPHALPWWHTYYCCFETHVAALADCQHCPLPKNNMSAWPLTFYSFSLFWVQGSMVAQLVAMVWVGAGRWSRARVTSLLCAFAVWGQGESKIACCCCFLQHTTTFTTCYMLCLLVLLSKKHTLTIIVQIHEFYNLLLTLMLVLPLRISYIVCCHLFLTMMWLISLAPAILLATTTVIISKYLHTHICKNTNTIDTYTHMLSHIYICL